LPAQRGLPQIEVSFDIDANGIVNVHAVDKGTGVEQSIKIVASEKLKDEEIEKMKKEAEEHATEDEKVKKEIEVINTADASVYSTEKMLEELKDKIDDDKKAQVTEKLDALKEELKKDPKDAKVLEEKLNELNTKLQEIGTEVYQKAQAEQQAEQQAQQQSSGTDQKNESTKDKKEGDEKVVDAEFKEKTDDKK
jgi:molecular chaperone DnaK